MIHWVKYVFTYGFMFFEPIWFCCCKYCLLHMSDLKLVTGISYSVKRLTSGQSRREGVVCNPFDLLFD